MRRTISLLICSLVFLMSCTAADLKAVYSETVYEPADNPGYWTLELQKEVYDKLIRENNLEEVMHFRAFIESLAQYHHNEPVYEYNPVFLCYESYPDVLQLLYENQPGLFLHGNIDMGSYSESPFLYVLKTRSLDEVRFYFENSIPVLDVGPDMLYGSSGVGGPRFGIGGNLLLYVQDVEVRDYLISAGIPPEVGPKSSGYYYLRNEGVEVYSFPGYDSRILTILYRDSSFSVKSVLAYKVDGIQWVRIVSGETEGWVPADSVGYDSGI